MNIVALDIGNSNHKLALLTGTPPRVKLCKTFTEVPNSIPPLPQGFDSITISSVVPEKSFQWIRLLSESVKTDDIKILDRKILKHVPMEGLDEETIGLDRILAIIGAMVRKQPPFVLVDSGSAMTFNFVDRDGIFRGGFIMPGIQMMTESLSSCAGIGKIDHTKLEIKLPVASTTFQSVSNGVYFSVKGAVELSLEKIKNDTGILPDLIITGGGGEIVKNWVEKGEYFPYLVLEGIAVASS
ncbi:type III pantothenate kinase [candidate division WOR-3 bacterium]|nr:type III pantothenate kinase [candidate division WOR-3 bacterium]